ncbi:MAG: hypothetical protein QF363_09985 [Planctomycetaceae bacterium]|nr:hypothetical protein [Planctomycetaceae bacterium]
MYRRLLVTTVTAVMLGGLYGAYAGLVTPLLVVPPRSRPLPQDQRKFPTGPPKENAVWARRFLPSWAANARWQGRWGQTFFFAGQQEAIQGDNVVRCAPFALVQADPDGLGENSTTPVIVIADAAVVRFPESVDLDDPDPRLALGCSLDGAVEITGSDGLLIRGGNFLFERDTLRIVSDDPVQLSWEGHRGRAEGAEILLGSLDGKPGGPQQNPTAGGLPAGPIRQIRFLRNVQLALSLPSRHRTGNSPSLETWQITCGGQLVVDPRALTATLEENVRVMRPDGTGDWDTLGCRDLALRFRRREAADDEEKPDRPQMEFVDLVASGQQVTVASATNDLQARANRLMYVAEGGTVELAGDVSASWGRGRLKCRHASLARGNDGRVGQALCRGAGSLTWQGEGNPPVLASARWSKQMRLAPEPGTGLDVVDLEGDPLVRHGPEMALTATTIRIWLEPRERSAKNKADQAVLQSRTVRLSRLLARDHVGAITPRAYVATSALDVRFDPVTSEEFQARQRKRGARSDRETAIGKPAITPGPPQPEVPAMINAGSIRARLGVPPDGRGFVLQEIVTEGQVRMSHEGHRGQDPFEISGEQVRVAHVKTIGDVLTIGGRPARLRSGARTISGTRIQLQLAGGQGSIDGSGVLSLPIGRTIPGETVGADIGIRINWSERLVLAGSKLTFLGDVTAEHDSSRVTCEQLDITLTGPLDLRSEASGWRDVEIQQLDFRHAVQVTNYTYAEREQGAEKVDRVIPVNASVRSRRQPLEITKARLANLKIDRRSGDLKAGGPGWIQVWRQGRRRAAPLAPTALARANMPLELDAAHWQYHRIDFARMAVGNIPRLSKEFSSTARGEVSRSFATFEDRVQAVRGQVTRPGETIDPDRLGRDDGWLRCRSLQVSQETRKTSAEKTAVGPTAKPDENLSILANGDATFAVQLSGHPVYGRADTINWDAASDRYVLRSFGQQKATLWRKTQQAGPFVRAEAQRVEFSPRHRQLVLDRTTEALGKEN